MGWTHQAMTGMSKAATPTMPLSRTIPQNHNKFNCNPQQSFANEPLSYSIIFGSHLVALNYNNTKTIPMMLTLMLRKVSMLTLINSMTVKSRMTSKKQNKKRRKRWWPLALVLAASCIWRHWFSLWWLGSFLTFFGIGQHLILSLHHPKLVLEGFSVILALIHDWYFIVIIGIICTCIGSPWDKMIIVCSLLNDLL